MENEKKLGAVKESDDKLNKFGSIMSMRMQEIFEKEIRFYPNSGDYLFVAPVVIGRIVERNPLLTKDGNISSAIKFGTGMIVLDTDLLHYQKNPEIADYIHSMLREVISKGDLVYCESNTKNKLLSRIVKEEHLRMKASQEREEITAKLIETQNELINQRDEYERKIRYFETVFESKNQEAIHFKELYGKLKSKCQGVKPTTEL